MAHNSPTNTNMGKQRRVKILNRGLFVVVEGSEGRGKTTLVENIVCELSDVLHPKANRRLLVDTAAYPVRTSITGMKIDDMLKGKIPFDSILMQSLHIANKIEEMDSLKGMLNNNDIVVLDRYTPSSYVYCELTGVPYEWIHKTHKVLPEPDLTIILTGKYFGTKSSEVYDSKQAEIESLYLKCAQRFGWQVVSNDLPPDELAKKVADILLRTFTARLYPDNQKAMCQCCD